MSTMSAKEDANSTKSTSRQLVPPCVIEKCHEYDGILFPFNIAPRCLLDLKSFKVRSDDVFVITYLKSGTTWTLMIALLVKHDGDLSRLEGTFIMNEVPFLESTTVMPSSSQPEGKANESVFTSCQKADRVPTDAIRILKTHALPRFLPDDLTNDPNAKVIYVARNPKDAAVSYYHFCKYTDPLPDFTSWDDFFEEFLAERTPFGSWFENVLHWWNLRNHPNVLFLTYEGMKQDGRLAAKQISRFMGKPFSTDVIDKIAAATTFDAMKNSKVANPDLNPTSVPDIKFDPSNNKSFFRKGAVGDWKNYFSVEQNERFDKLYNKKIAGSGLELIFE